MPNPTKDKLLQILGDFAMDELSEIALMEVLAAKLKSQEAKISKLLRANGMERERLHIETERVYREHQELRRNPASIISGPFLFVGEKGEKYRIEIVRGQVSAFEIKKKNITYVLRQVSPAEFEVVHDRRAH